MGSITANGMLILAVPTTFSPETRSDLIATDRSYNGALYQFDAYNAFLYDKNSSPFLPPSG